MLYADIIGEYRVTVLMSLHRSKKRYEQYSGRYIHICAPNSVSHTKSSIVKAKRKSRIEWFSGKNKY